MSAEEVLVAEVPLAVATPIAAGWSRGRACRSRPVALDWVGDEALIDLWMIGADLHQVLFATQVVHFLEMGAQKVLAAVFPAALHAA